MNKIILGLLFATANSISFGQKIASDKVPTMIIASFNGKFPNAQKVKWEMEKPEYEANFELNNVEMSASFESSGKWIETETEINSSALPEMVRQTIKKDFVGFKVKEASQIESEKTGKCFEAELEKGDEKYDVLFTPEGKRISQSKIDKKEK